MEQGNMTALVSAFSRAYHSERNTVKVFDDYLAKEILTREEYELISANMAKGIKFFNPAFEGTEEEALRWVVDNQLSPSPLGRTAFAERALENAVKRGVEQYLVFAAGYDTFACRQPDWARNISIFELDHSAVGADKRRRIGRMMEKEPSNLYHISADFTEMSWVMNLLACPGFKRSSVSFCSLLGIVYYLSEKDFRRMVGTISNITPNGSAIVFDYPDEFTYTPQAGERAKRQVAMAGAAGEKMLSSYSSGEMEKLLADNDFLIVDHLTPGEITEQYFMEYNMANPDHPMSAFDNVNYCLAVKYA